MNKIFIRNLIFASIILSFSVSCMKQKENLILNESFDVNNRGWVEEDSNFHKLEIKDGNYHISSIDSTLDRTSSRSLDKSFLFNLPESYIISTTMEIIKSDFENPYCGLLLESASFEYEVRVSENGKVEFEEYNFFNDELNIAENLKKVETEDVLKRIEIEIRIDGWFFELLVNNQILGKGKLSSKSWDRIGPFAGKFTEIKVDNLIIK